MRTFVAGASGAPGPRLISQPVDHGHKMMGICRSPGNGERVRALGAEPIAFGPQPAARRRITGRS